MADSPKNPNVERLAGMPFDKDSVSPLPQFAPRDRTPGADVTTAPLPSEGGEKPNGQEEYPGPQTASSGEHVEPGRAPVQEESASGDRSDVNQPAERGETEPAGRGRAKGGSHGRA